jgi:hypothetical protein
LSKRFLWIDLFPPSMKIHGAIEATVTNDDRVSDSGGLGR